MLRGRTLTALAVLLTFGLVVAGCGGGADQQETSTTETTTESSATGSLVATVNFEGEAPDPETYDASGNSECGVDEVKGQKVVVNDNGTLKNAVVAVKSGPSGLDKSAGDLKINQKDCQYNPHISTAKVGQEIEVGDKDQGLHNVRGTNQDGKQLFNLQTFQGQSKTFTIDNTGVVSLECDVHPWMQSWIYVTEHGAAGVTDDSGEVSLSDLPAGEYELEIWHEEYGKQSKTVTVEEGSEASVSVTISA